ncbi:MAG: hypothetical protein IPL57_08635 [Rubrivivax sp.]|nr:hypothetical protein [Rubrivivax sp.]
MLSDIVLADIARPSPTQHLIVTAAWPSLSVESRLQVIAAVQGTGLTRSTPEWLLDLAMQDQAAIVRYWATRAAYFREVGPVDFTAESESGFFEPTPAAPADLERVRAARNDPSELVRLSVDRLGLFDVEKLSSMPQQQRLLAIRNQGSPSFSSFVDWLCKAVEQQVPDDDLAACSAEFFALPEVNEQMRNDDFDDGMAAHLEGKAMTDAWALLKHKAGPRLTSQLVYALPVKRGLGTVKAEELAAMPERILRSLLHRQGDGEAFLELAEMIRKEPDRFPPDVVKSLKRDDEDYCSMPDAQARVEHGLTNALDRQAATIQLVVGVRREIGRLRERLDQIYEAATRKRGFFG